MKDKSNQSEKDTKEGSNLQIAGDLVAGLSTIWMFFSKELSKDSNADLIGLGSIEFLCDLCCDFIHRK